MVKLIASEIVDGGTLQTFELKNKNGLRAVVTNLGARVMKIFTPDREGNFGDICAGYDTAREYLADTNYFGAVVGRVANRVDSPLTFEGQTLTLDCNDGDYSLHGGSAGYEKRLFAATVRGSKLELTLHSPDGDQGYPGNLDVTVKYTLNNEDELVMELAATCDRNTLCNLTNHTYFNLGDSEYILGTKLRIRSSAITAYDPESRRGRMIPTPNTDFDFSRSKAILRDILSAEPLIRQWGGYDFNYVLDDGEGPDAEAYDPESGRVLQLFTDAPAVQFYSGCVLSEHGKGREYKKYSAFCLEAQGFPFAPNEPAFPSVRLAAGKKYRRRIVYKFSAR